jgi:hypothetical protein
LKGDNNYACEAIIIVFDSFTVVTMVWFTDMEYMCRKWPRICSTCRKHFPVLSSFMIYHRICNQINMSLVKQELLTLPEHLSSPVISGVCVSRSLVLCVLFCKSVFVFFCLSIVYSVVRFTDSDYPLAS